jgi:hypothetical protein
MRFDVRLEDRISRITPSTDNGENRTENGEWKMESETAKENEGTTCKESSLGSFTRGNGMSPLHYLLC